MSQCSDIACIEDAIIAAITGYDLKDGNDFVNYTDIEIDVELV